VAFKNLQLIKKPANVEVEMAVGAVERIPNAMDMDFADVDPDPTSLDLATDGTDESRPNHQHPAEECILCGQALGED